MLLNLEVADERAEIQRQGGLRGTVTASKFDNFGDAPDYDVLSRRAVVYTYPPNHPSDQISLDYFSVCSFSLKYRYPLDRCSRYGVVPRDFSSRLGKP